MESFRNLIRGWLGKVLLAIFMVPFALVGIESYFAGGGGDQEAAKVGQQSISRQEFDQVYTRQRQQALEQVKGDETQLDEAVLREQVLRGLVSRALLLEQARTLGLELSTAQVADLIRKEPSFQDNGKFSEAKFAQFLQGSGQTRDQLIATLRQQMSVQQLVSGISQTAISPARELDQLLAIQGEKRHVQTASLPLDLNAVAVTDAQVQQQFQANAKAYRMPASVDLEYMVLNAAQFAAQAQVSEAELQGLYQARLNSLQGNAERHAQHILISVDAQTPDAAAKKQAQDLLARIQKGEDFAALAKQYSKDPGSAVNGGDLGFAAKGTYVPAFEAALDQLKAGQVASAPVKTEFGYHIIKLLDSRQPTPPAFEALKPELLAEAQKTKAAELFNEAVSKINEQAVDAEALKTIAQTYQLPVQTATGLTRTAQAGGDLAHPDVLRTAFSDESLHDRRISAGVPLDAERVLWLRVTQAHAERAQTLAEAAPLIRAQLQAEAAFKQVKAKADQVVAALRGGQSLQAVSQQFGLTFADAGLIERTQGLPNKALQSAVFRLPAPAAGQWQATWVGDAKTGIELAALSEVQPSALQQVPADVKAQTRKMLTDLLGQQELSDYVEYLRQHAKIKPNPKLMDVAKTTP